jgi:hypothetical protein
VERPIISREKDAFGMLPMQQKRIRIFGCGFIGLGVILGSIVRPQNTTLRYDRSTTCNCILEARAASLNGAEQ